MQPSPSPSLATSKLSVAVAAAAMEHDPETPPQSASDNEFLRLDFEPTFSALAKVRRPPVTLEWRRVAYKINQRKILHGLSGQANPGEVVALMGPSGAGKTTLLNVLAGRVRDGMRRGHALSAEVLANGAVVDPATLAFRRRIAYVVQDDALYATATARESLEFSAKLRLPGSMSATDRTALVNDIVSSLGLSKVQHTMVGSPLVRGLSGGERKRVSIGVELVSGPSILFLDEPTSGLDSVSAWKVVRILRAIANLGGRPSCTIVCSIHQPSSEVFFEFTHCVFLGAGHIVYQGPTSLAELDSVFRPRGFAIPLYANSSDFVMMAIQLGDQDALPRDDGNERAPRTHSSSLGLDANVEGGDLTLGHAGFMVQALELSKREIRGLVRDWTPTAARYATIAFLGVMMAVIFNRNADQTYKGYATSALYGSLVMLVLGTFVGNVLPQLLTIPLDKVVNLREMSTATYGVVPYMLSKVVVEIPVIIGTCFVGLVIPYWSVGYRSNFGEMLVWLSLSVEAGISFCYIIGAVADTPQKSIELAPVVIVPQFLFIGLFSPISSLPSWLQWPQWLASFKYTLNLMAVSEFHPKGCESPAVCAQWSALLASNDIEDGNSWWWALLLVALAVGLRFVAMGIMFIRAKSV